MQAFELATSGKGHDCRSPNSRCANGSCGITLYPKQYGVPKTPADLHRHVCINWRFPGSGAIHRWDLQKRGKRIEISVEGAMISNHQDVVVGGALQGLGILNAYDDRIHDLIARGRLKRVLADWSPAVPGISLIFEPASTSTGAPGFHRLPARPRRSWSHLHCQRQRILDREQVGNVLVYSWHEAVDRCSRLRHASLPHSVADDPCKSADGNRRLTLYISPHTLPSVVDLPLWVEGSDPVNARCADDRRSPIVTEQQQPDR